ITAMSAVSDDGGPAFHLGECLADALDGQFDPVGPPDIYQEHVVFAILDQRVQAGLQLGAPPRRQAALEDRQLDPFAIAVHDLEDAAPAPLIRNVIGNDEKVFFGHRRLIWADSADSSVVRPAESATAAAPGPVACGACSPGSRTRDASSPGRG